MAANSFGEIFRVTTFGESHGHGLGCVVDGCPAGLQFGVESVQVELDRRRPGQNPETMSARKELDQVEILSGVFEGLTLGTPIAMLVRNQDARSEDYAKIQANPRKDHSDVVWKQKYGVTDHRGGGRSSGRETVSRVMGGAVAKLLLKSLIPGFESVSFVESVGPYKMTKDDFQLLKNNFATNSDVDAFPLKFPSTQFASVANQAVVDAKTKGESYGGVGAVWVRNLPMGLGQPVFHKLKADLARACLSVGSTHSFRLGLECLAPATIYETGANYFAEDRFFGEQGGISNGTDLIVSVGFKPTSTRGENALKGRHDPCIVPRAIVVLEAMVNLVLADHALWQRLDRV